MLNDDSHANIIFHRGVVEVGGGEGRPAEERGHLNTEYFADVCKDGEKYWIGVREGRRRGYHRSEWGENEENFEALEEQQKGQPLFDLVVVMNGKEARIESVNPRECRMEVPNVGLSLFLIE